MQTRTTSLAGTKQSLLSDSLVGSWAQKLSFPLISEFLILSSIFFFWYEGFLPVIGLGFLTTISLPSILLVLALVFADKSKVRIIRSHVYLILFLVAALFSGVLAAYRGISPTLIISGWLLFAQFLIAILAGQGAEKPQRLLTNIVYLSLPMIAVGAYQFLTKQATLPLWVTPAETSIATRAFAFFGSPNVLGAVLAIIVIVSAGLYLQNEDKIMGVVSVLATIVTIFTFSRSAWLGLVVGIAVVLLIKNYKLVIFSPLALLVLLFSQVRTRVLAIFALGYWLDSSLDGRLWSLNNGIHIWAKYPVFGSGPGTYGGKFALNYSSPVYLQGIQNGYVALYFTDNQWLQLLVQTGILGLLLFALFTVNVFVELINKYTENKSWTILGVAGAFIAFLISGFFGNVLEFGAIAVPMGILIGVANSER